MIAILIKQLLTQRIDSNETLCRQRIAILIINFLIPILFLVSAIIILTTSLKHDDLRLVDEISPQSSLAVRNIPDLAARSFFTFIVFFIPIILLLRFLHLRYAKICKILSARYILCPECHHISLCGSVQTNCALCNFSYTSKEPKSPKITRNILKYNQAIRGTKIAEWCALAYMFIAILSARSIVSFLLEATAIWLNRNVGVEIANTASVALLGLWTPTLLARRWLLWRRSNLMLVEYARRRRCALCDYDLSAIDDPKRCPECGLSFVATPPVGGSNSSAASV